MSSFFRTLPETLQQPAALAMLGSLGAHLLFFATLPAFTNSTEPRPEAEVRQVRLLEPPQGSNSQVANSRLGLPPVPNTPNSRIQLPPIGQGTSPIPNPLYTIPDLTTPIPVPVPSQPQPQTRFRTSVIPEDILRRIRQPNPPQPPQEKPVTQQPQPKQSPTSSPGGLTPADPRIATGTTPTPPTPNQPAQPQTPATTPPTSQNQNRDLIALTRYNPQGTTQQELFTASTNYTQSLQQKNIAWERIVLRQPTEPIKEVPFPEGLVLNNYDKRQHPVAIAILVDKDGKPLPDTKPEILASTGYGVLNEKAEEIVKATAIPENLVPLIQKHEAQKEDPKSRNKAQAYLLVYEFQFKAPNAAAASVPQQN